MRVILVVGLFFCVIAQQTSVEGKSQKKKLCMINVDKEFCVNGNSFLGHVPYDSNKIKYEHQKNDATAQSHSSKELVMATDDLYDDLEDCGYREKLKPPENLEVVQMFLENSVWTGFVELQWETPPKQQRFTTYQVEYAEKDTGDWLIAGEKAVDLEEDMMQVRVDLNRLHVDLNKTFQFRVRSKNIWTEPTWYCALGDPSNIASAYKPSCPKNVKFTNIDGKKDTITIKWELPDETGSSDIMQYLIKYKNRKQGNNWEVVGTAKSIQLKATVTIDGKTDVKDQSFLVVAVNVAGMSDNCLPVSIVKPSCPTNANITFIDDEKHTVTMKWQVPENTGTSDIFQYIIKYRNRKNGKQWNTAGKVNAPQLEATVNINNENPSEQAFMVEAENIAGLSDNCRSDYVEYPDKPSQLKVLSINKYDGTVILQFLPPEYCGNRNCTQFDVNVWEKVLIPKHLPKNSRFIEFKKFPKDNDYIHLTFKTSDLKMYDPDQKIPEIDLKGGKKYELAVYSHNEYFKRAPGFVVNLN